MNHNFTELSGKSGEIATELHRTTRQDFAYEYNLSGNILKIKVRTPDCGLSATPDQLDRLFSYDPINRLLSATGRESDTQSPNLQWNDYPTGMRKSQIRNFLNPHSAILIIFVHF